MIDTVPRRSSRARSCLPLVVAFVSACSGGDNPENAAPESEPPPPARPASGLEGASWELVRVEMMDGADMLPSSAAVPSVEFMAADVAGEPDRIGGSGGCNTLTAEYRVPEEGRLAVSRADLEGGRVCSDPVMRLEQLFLIGLQSATTYEQASDSLAVVFAGGTLRLERRARSPAP